MQIYTGLPFLVVFGFTGLQPAGDEYYSALRPGWLRADGLQSKPKHKYTTKRDNPEYISVSL